MRQYFSRSIKLAIILAVSVFTGLVLSHLFTWNSPVPSLALESFQAQVQTSATRTNLERAEAVAKAIIAACPLSAPNDAKAFAACGDKLGQSAVLDQTANTEFLWGQQQSVGNYDLKANPTTLFNPLVWRRLYLATFMFPGTYQVEQVGNRIILHLPIQFRNQLDLGAYPYPFWHSKKKWDAYQTSKELLFIMEGGKFFGALRSAERDPSRTTINHNWDGQWAGTGKDQPTGMLYTQLLSSSNPYITELNQAFRAYEIASRPFNCVLCHSPDNAAQMNPLILFNYPNQALSSRHEIVSAIADGTMPPVAIVIQGDRKIVTPAGVADATEKEKLLRLAKVFAEVGDRALAYEQRIQSAGQTKPR